MREKRPGASGDDEHILFIKLPPPGVGKQTRNLSVEMALARLEAVLNDVKADLRTVKQAALAFREALRMQSEQCTTHSDLAGGQAEDHFLSRVPGARASVLGTEDDSYALSAESRRRKDGEPDPAPGCVSRPAFE